MLDLVTEEILQEFCSITDAAIFTGNKKLRSNIGKVLTKERNHACGYKWKFKEV